MAATQAGSVRKAEADVMISALMPTAVDGDPNTYEEAMASDENELWKAAIREECTSMIRNKTSVHNSTGSISALPYNSGRAFGSGKYWCLRLH